MKRLTIKSILLSLLAAILLTASVFGQETAAGPAEDTDKTIRILATSDLHGKFYPWDYNLNEEDTTGSVVQLATAIAEYRNDNTLLVDAGDTVQDNSADIFMGEAVHPMMQALNKLGYEIWVTGNHEYDYDQNTIRKTIASFDGKVLTGNVYDENGDLIADGYTIIEKNGIRIAVIGMVTPCILNYDPISLTGWMVTNPVLESRKIIDQLQGQYDVLLGVMHMGLETELSLKDSCVRDLAAACPEFDVIVASHEHKLIESTDINGVLVTENLFKAQSMSVIDLDLKKTEDGWTVANKTAHAVDISDYEPDAELTAYFADYDKKAREDAESVLGTIDGDALSPKNEIDKIPTMLIRDTALVDLINDTQMYYAKADVSATPTFSYNMNLYRGDVRKCDLQKIYPYSNTLYKLRMTGAQLKKFMEWSACFYNQYNPGDLTISFNATIAISNYEIFSGVNYDINIANEPGFRIENLTWPDGSDVKDDDTFIIAVNSHRANAYLLIPGIIYEENDLPELLEGDIRSDIGGVREQIGAYIKETTGGLLTTDCDNNWKITGNNWDEDLHQKVVELTADGTIEIPCSENGYRWNLKAITEEDLP